MKQKTTMLTIALAILLTLGSGCSTYLTVSSMGAIRDGKLIKTASFDTGVPKNKIKVVQKSESMGSGLYTLDIDGEVVKYKRTGTIYHKADQSPIPQ